VRKNTRKIVPEWEFNLWYFLSIGTGETCPLYVCCPTRKQHGWCPDEQKKYTNRLIDSEEFDVGDYDWIEDENGGPCRMFKLVEKLAYKYLKKAGIQGPPVLTEAISLFDSQHTTEVREVPLKACHGAIWNIDNKWVIQLNINETPAMKRYTLFHEVFHILAHLEAKPVFRRPIFGSQLYNKRPGETYFNEKLASYFSACFLAPRDMVEEWWAHVMDVDRMSEIFDLPKSVMWIRLRKFGLI